MYNCVVDAAIATFTDLRAEAMPIPSDGPLREHVEKVVSIVELCHVVLANDVIFSKVSFYVPILFTVSNNKPTTIRLLSSTVMRMLWKRIIVADNHSFSQLHGHADALKTNYCCKYADARPCKVWSRWATFLSS